MCCQSELHSRHAGWTGHREGAPALAEEEEAGAGQGLPSQGAGWEGSAREAKEPDRAGWEPCTLQARACGLAVEAVDLKLPMLLPPPSERPAPTGFCRSPIVEGGM